MDKRRFRSVLVVFACALFLLDASIASATFHIAHISEVMTSYNGSADVQFVEITMDALGQNLVSGTKLNVFDTSGDFVATVLTVPSNVSSGNGRSWIMATPGWETDTGVSADFTFPNASLPEGGGMICWGKPGTTPTPVSCPLSGIPYVDCIAYGTYSGPTNSCIGTPTPLTPDGHSLQKVGAGTDNNANDFVCADTATPTNNANETASMPATTPCSAATTTLPGATTTTVSVTSTTLPGGTLCGDANGDDAITASDALAALRTAVGTGTCSLALCDVDDNGSVSASDALRILQRAVGTNIELTCPVA